MAAYGRSAPMISHIFLRPHLTFEWHIFHSLVCDVLLDIAGRLHLCHPCIVLTYFNLREYALLRFYASTFYGFYFDFTHMDDIQLRRQIMKDGIYCIKSRCKKLLHQNATVFDVRMIMIIQRMIMTKR